MTFATEKLRQQEEQQHGTNTSTDSTITAIPLPRWRTLSKAVSLSVKATKNSSRYERDGEFALEILREAVELTRPWLSIVEKELERLGLDVEEERGRRSGKQRSGGGDDGLLAVVPGVANMFLRLLRSGRNGGDGRKLSLLRDMYASVHTNLLSAEEKVAILEREVASKRKKRRKRRTTRAAESDGEGECLGVSQPQREPKAKHAVAAASSTIPNRSRDLATDAPKSNAGEADDESPSGEDSEIAPSAAAVPPSATSMDSSVKRLPRSDSLETQMTVGDKRSRKSRSISISIRPGESAATHKARDDDESGSAITASTKASNTRSKTRTGSTGSRKRDSSRGSRRSPKSKGSEAKHRPGPAYETRGDGPPEMMLPNIGETMANSSENRSREPRTDRKSAAGAESGGISREHSSLKGGAASTHGDLEGERSPIPSPSSSPLHDDVKSHSHSAIGNHSSSRGGEETDIEHERCSPNELSSMLKEENLGRGSPSAASCNSRHSSNITNSTRGSSASSSKQSRRSVPGSSPSREPQEHLTPKTSLSAAPQKSRRASRKSATDKDSRQSSVVSRGRSRTSRLRVIKEDEATCAGSNDQNHDAGAEACQPFERSCTESERQSAHQTDQDTAPAAPTRTSANLSASEDSRQGGRRGDSTKS